jgi:O-antigen/teichoic acid export membrane protein
VNPFRNILRLSFGDFFAKTLYFLAFVYLARVLGVESYGVLEFANASLMYFLFMADGGLELWATREVARGTEIQKLVARIVLLRFLLAVCAFVALLALLPAFPKYPALKTVLVLFGLTLFVQAINLKWVVMGQERMARVATGLVVAQIVFTLGIFGFVHSPKAMVAVPLFKLFGDVAMAVYFLWIFKKTYGNVVLIFSLSGVRNILQPALTMGAAHGLAIASYNLDSILLGFLKGSTEVGWYNAAYRPVTAILAMPVTYFIGLFPVLSRSYVESGDGFREMVIRSLRLMAIFAVPVGVGGTFFAEPIVNVLFGPAYKNSVPALQILSWSAVLVMLRGTYRQSLNAAGKQHLDLRCAGTAIAINLGLNLLLIPRFGIIGAAASTLTAELIWLALASYFCYRHIAPMTLFSPLLQPVIAAIAMGTFFLLAQPLFWIAGGFIGLLVYFGTLLLLGQSEVRAWVFNRRVRVS